MYYNNKNKICFFLSLSKFIIFCSHEPVGKIFILFFLMIDVGLMTLLRSLSLDMFSITWGFPYHWHIHIMYDDIFSSADWIAVCNIHVCTTNKSFQHVRKKISSNNPVLFNTRTWKQLYLY